MDLEIITQWAHLSLEWVGFGTVVGLLAKAVLRGRDDSGALATVLLGILGSVMGASLLAFFIDGVHISPISVLGFFVALGGTTLLLLSYRLIGGGRSMMGMWGRYGKRRPHTTVIEEA
jgi:uncharacterized membrane protein YeaQ/YmgE (transglycosylase-associated protein family)